MISNTDSIQITSIRDNLTLIVDSFAHVSGCSIGAWFPYGSGHEVDGEYGLTHFLEHMLFKGTGTHSASELSRLIDRVGGYLNAFTERDTLCLHCTVPARYYDIAMQTMLEMLYDPVFRLDDFNKEKDIIRNEILSSDDDIEESGNDVFFSRMYPSHSFGRKIAGEVGEVAELSIESLQLFHKKIILDGHCLITVAGACDAESLAACINAKLQTIPILNQNISPKSRLTDITTSAKADKFRIIRKAPGSQTHFYTAIPLEKKEGSWNSTDFWAFSLISSAYGESMSSRLFMRLREDRGLCYNITSFASFYQFASHWGINASTSPEQFPEFADAYKHESNLLYEKGLSDIEIHEAVTRMEGYLFLAADDSEYRMKRIARQYMFESRVDSIVEIQALFSVNTFYTADIINEYIRTYAKPADENILVYGKLSYFGCKAAAALGVNKERRYIR